MSATKNHRYLEQAVRTTEATYRAATTKADQLAALRAWRAALDALQEALFEARGIA